MMYYFTFTSMKWKWSRSVVSDSATPWTVAHQAPLPMGFSRQEYWNGLPFPSPADFRDPRIKPASLALTSRFFTTEPPGKWKSLSHVWLFATPWTIYSPWNSLGQNIGVCNLSLLQGIFPTQESNPSLLHCQEDSLPLSHLESPTE